MERIRREFSSNVSHELKTPLRRSRATSTRFWKAMDEANISYPSDAGLMTKPCGIAAKVVRYLKKKTRGFIDETLAVDLKKVRSKAREYWFTPRNKAREVKNAIFQELHHEVKKQMRPIIELCQSLDAGRLKRLPWNIKRSIEQINSHGWRYLLDVAHFIRSGSMKTGKILSLHAQQVACITKGKIHKMHEFGRVIQLGRIKGNFMLVLESTDIQMPDKLSFSPFIEEHKRLFGAEVLKSLATDKGYYSRANVRAAKAAKITEVGIQKPSTVKAKISVSQVALQEKLRDGRAGIEPLIGHAKHAGQLGRSRMKSDAATKAAAYGSVLGLNLRQLIRHQAGNLKSKAA